MAVESGVGLALERQSTGQVIASPAQTAKAASSAMARIEQHPQWPVLARLPMRMSVSVKLPNFRVRNLLALRPDQTISSSWPSTEDVALELGSVHVFWCEFEVVEQRLAVRLTRLP